MLDKIRGKIACGCKNTLFFKPPEMKCLKEPNYHKTLYCPKCYQDQTFRHYEDECHPYPHTIRESAKNPSSTFSALEEEIMDRYPFCKEIGLSLCVDKDQPKAKLNLHVLTHRVMMEVAIFARRLSGNKNRIIHELIQHNFNIRV